MLRIIYISTARQAVTSADLASILNASRRNNAAAGVTGLLIVGGRRFLQALEGPEAAVQSVFERIQRDPRHFGVVILSRTTVERRGFGEWAMGYKAGGSDAGPDLLTRVANLVAPIEDETTRAYFTGFAALHAA